MSGCVRVTRVVILRRPSSHDSPTAHDKRRRGIVIVTYFNNILIRNIKEHEEKERKKEKVGD